jgi:uncharacterized DUF497 family protein
VNVEWDPRKDARNQSKHGVPFDEAQTVFYDALAVTYPDLLHSGDELREITIGLSLRGRVLVVVHTERHGYTRIISAREATRQERATLEEGSNGGGRR